MSQGNGHHRWSKFWWTDWQNNIELKACSLAARGLWIELLCIAHEGAPTGHVTINGRAPTAKQIAALVGAASEREVVRLLAELETAGVFSRTPEGIIFNRRMVRDAAASEAGREHVNKRWGGNGQDTHPNSPPIRGGHRGPTRDPNEKPIGGLLGTLLLEAEEERRKEVKGLRPLNPIEVPPLNPPPSGVGLRLVV